MVTNTDIFAFKAKIHKLKHKLKNEPVPESQKWLADLYLNEVLFLLEELKP